MINFTRTLPQEVSIYFISFRYLGYKLLIFTKLSKSTPSEIFCTLLDLCLKLWKSKKKLSLPLQGKKNLFWSIIVCNVPAHVRGSSITQRMNEGHGNLDLTTLVTHLLPHQIIRSINPKPNLPFSHEATVPNVSSSFWMSDNGTSNGMLCTWMLRRGFLLWTRKEWKH